MVTIRERLASISPMKQFGMVNVLGLAILIVLGVRSGGFISLWLTPDQHGRWLYEHLEFSQAMDQFEDPMWKGRAGYAAGRYIESADAFGRVPSAQGFFNRGNAFMRGREYAKAIISYEQAVAEAPKWVEAIENLELSRYVLEYIERTREQSDTGDETELSADDFKFDNTGKKGLEMVITEQSTLEMESAEKWMRGVDSKTSDFLRTRFFLEAALGINQ